MLAFEMKCLRRICGVTWEDRISNQEIRERTGQNVNIMERIRDGQRRWFGHVQRMGGQRWPKTALHGRVDGMRPRGRPRDSWIKIFKREI